MKPQIVIVPKYPGQSQSPSILVMWTPDEWEVKVQIRAPLGGILASESLDPKQARKLARALLKAANQAEGRPTPRMWSDDEDDGPVVVEM